MNRLLLVYFIYINPNSNWRRIIYGQLNDLKCIGILNNFEIHIHICDTHHIATSEEFVKKICPKAVVSTSEMNYFEYEGIQLAYSLAKQNSNAIIGYLHTKGMSKGISQRLPVEKLLTNMTFKNWKYHVRLLKEPQERINKIGFMPSENGKYVWINFWLARADYIANLQIPKLTDDRFYYEEWLGLTKNKNSKFYDTYNIYDPANKSGYSSAETGKILYELCLKKYPLYFYRLKIRQRITQKIKSLKYRILAIIPQK